jgi:predicted transcriptional regulator
MVMIFATTLEDGAGKVLQRNFVPFRVKGAIENKMVVTRKPSEFTAAEWSVKYKQVLDGRKVWGMGSGYFEYEFAIPEGTTAENIENIEFRAELASRYPQEKYLEDGDAEGIGMTIVSEKGTIPGYGKNSFPQTDEKKHGSLVTIAANNQKIAQVELTDDPADHNGLLSWMNQIPGWEWGAEDRSKPWTLEEAGSYGYVVTASLDEVSKKSSFETGKIIIRMYVDEAGSNRGGLSVYGAESGKYPMDPSMIFKLKR